MPDVVCSRPLSEKLRRSTTTGGVLADATHIRGAKGRSPARDRSPASYRHSRLLQIAGERADRVGARARSRRAKHRVFSEG